MTTQRDIRRTRPSEISRVGWRFKKVALKKEWDIKWVYVVRLERECQQSRERNGGG